MMSSLSLNARSDLLVRAAEMNKRSSFRDLVELLWRVDRTALFAEPELVFFLAHGLYRQERHAESLELLEALEGACRRAGRNRLYRRRLNLQGVILLTKGNITRAEQLFQEVQRSATASGDQEYIAYCTLNLGTIFSIRGEWFPAFTTLQRAAAAFQKLGRPYGLAACHQNLAITYYEVDRLPDAEAELERAYELFTGISTDLQLELASTDIQRALVVLAYGDIRQAEEIVNLAKHRLDVVAQQSPAMRHEGEVFRARALILLGMGRNREAREALENGLRCAEAADDVLLQAQTLEVLSLLEAEVSNASAARVRSFEAAQKYMSLGAAARAARVGDPSPRYPRPSLTRT
jgi:tetratricopeptide (TPR) repeat protein